MSDCFRCDGTGEICNICGESRTACGCSDEEIAEYVAECGDQFDACDDCAEVAKT